MSLFLDFLQSERNMVHMMAVPKKLIGENH